jgi:hypothetical protein
MVSAVGCRLLAYLQVTQHIILNPGATKEYGQRSYWTQAGRRRKKKKKEEAVSGATNQPKICCLFIRTSKRQSPFHRPRAHGCQENEKEENWAVARENRRFQRTSRGRGREREREKMMMEKKKKSVCNLKPKPDILPLSPAPHFLTVASTAACACVCCPIAGGEPVARFFPLPSCRLRRRLQFSLLGNWGTMFCATRRRSIFPRRRR